MRGIIRKVLERLKSQSGFSLVEVVVGGFVLVVGLVMMSQFFASAASRVMESDVRSVLHQVATQDLESIRGLDYGDVATQGGWPVGPLADYETRTVQNLTVRIHRVITTWTDSSYTGPYPFNYRRVTVSVTAVNHDSVKAVELTTNVAGGLEGGSLDITVTDITGAPVPDAQLVITNTHLIPNLNINSTAMRTDSYGKMIVPGLPPDDTPSYVVTVSKSGYNTESSDPAVLVDGLPYTVVHLTIDRLSTMNVRVIDTNGVPVTGLNLTIVGPEDFSEAFASSSSGTAFTDIRYSTDTDPYIVRLLDGQGYDAQEQAIVLAPGTAEDVVFTVPAGGPTTTTTLPPTTTTSVVATTTTTTTGGGSSSLTIRVVRSSSGYPIYNAIVSLNPGGQVKTTNSNGYVNFTGLSNRTYSLVITKDDYYDYRGDVVVVGARSVTIALTPRWWW